MRQFLWVTAGAAALALTACYPANETQSGETPTVTEVTSLVDEDLAPFMRLLEAEFVQTDASEVDLTPVAAAMPASAGLEWEAASFDPETGATVFTGLVLSVGTNTSMGVRFEEAHLWGLDSDFLIARLQGERLDESGPLITRFDGRNFSYFGVDTLINAAIDGFIDVMAAEEDMPAGFEVAIDAFDYTGERFLMTDVSLLPWEYTPIDPAILPADFDEDPEIKDLMVSAMHYGQQFVAGYRTIAYDAALVTNLTGDMAMRQPGSKVTFETSIELYGASSVSGFDWGKTVAHNVDTLQSTEYVEIDYGDDEFGEFSTLGMPVGLTIMQDTSYTKAVSTDIELNKALGYLSRGEWPSMDERDLLSLGTSTVTDFDIRLNDGNAFAAREIQLKADRFEWLIPSVIELTVDDGAMSVSDLSVFAKGFIEAFANDASEYASDTQAEEMAMLIEGIDKGIALLPDYGLDTITLDGSFTATWEADQGPAEFQYSVDSVGFGAEQFSLALNFPVYETLKAASMSDDVEIGIETAFQDAFAIRSARYFQEDKGGYDKILGFVNAIGAEYPEQGWGAMVSNMDPAQMRAYGATIVRMGRAGAEADFPPAVEWLDAIAAYVETGGSIEMAMRPNEPVTIDTFDELDEADDPQFAVDRLGLSVTHTPK